MQPIFSKMISSTKQFDIAHVEITQTAEKNEFLLHCL